MLFRSLIIALGANAVNMLDVRPGRALKGYWAVFAAVVFGSAAAGMLPGVEVWVAPGTMYLFAPILIWTICYAPVDFGRRGMMGDAGSNTLGAVMGLLIVTEFAVPARLFFLAMLVCFQVFCEVYSLSGVIEKSRLLTRLDALGVKKTD